MAVLSLRCRVLLFLVSASVGLLLTAVQGLLIVAASLVAEHGLQAHGLQAHGLQAHGLPTLWPVGAALAVLRLHSAG